MNIDTRWVSWLALIVIGVLIGILAVGILELVSSQPVGEPVKLIPPPTPLPVLAHISGAVNQPDVYELPPGSRIRDAVSAAGGFTEDADPGSINLAAILSDGDRVFIPFIPDSPEVLLVDDEHTRSFENIPLEPSENFLLIDLNLASKEDLDQLPGIGPVKAEAIISHRNKLGGFTRIEEILDVPGIGEKTFNSIKGLIKVGDNYR
jgi:competence protein ComEA